MLSTEGRAEDDMLGAFLGGDGAVGGICDPRHCDCCGPAVTVVMVVLLTTSLLFCKAYFRRFERLGFEVSWVVGASPESGNAADKEFFQFRQQRF